MIFHLYSRLEEKDKALLLQIIAKRIIVNPGGEIIDHELHSPFAYLHGIVVYLRRIRLEPHGSEQLPLGAQYIDTIPPVNSQQSCR